jgi:hypothetical protein
MTPNEEQTAFYEQLGRCIAQWSHVEDGLGSVYATAVAPPNQRRVHNIAAQAAFYAIQSPEVKISTTSAAVTFRLLNQLDEKGRDILGLWRPLMKKIGERRQRRNQLAHFQVVYNAEAKPGRRCMLRPAIFNPNAILRPIKSFHCPELQAIARSFGRSSEDLRIFVYSLALYLGQCDEDADFEERLTQLRKRMPGVKPYTGAGLFALI